MKVLLLAGTSDARRIAVELTAMNGINLIASLAGVTRQPAKMPCETRVGGFGGVEGLRDYVRQVGIDAIVDATHPFAAQMSASAAQASSDLGVKHIQMLRPKWHPQAGDLWTAIASEEAAVAHIEQGATVFLATGRQTLPAFENLTNRRLICRQIDPPDGDFPFPNGQFLIGRPPFSVADEMQLFQALNIDWLVVKNSGAEASRSKLDAARELAIRVAMIDRPIQPKCNRATRVEEVVNWVAALKDAE
jgi:precorrin-6A/cobalt-precorrin-6A reductase